MPKIDFRNKLNSAESVLIHDAVLDSKEVIHHPFALSTGNCLPIALY